MGYIMVIRQKLPRGFTLIELLIAITLLATLSALLLVGLNPFEQIKKGADSVKRTIANDVYNAITHVSIKSGNQSWKTDLIGVLLSSAEGGDAIASLISAGELTSGFQKITEKDLSKIALTSTADGSILRLCFLPESSSLKQSTDTKYDRYGNYVNSCPDEGCYTCVTNGVEAPIGSGIVALSDGLGGGSSPIPPTSTPVVIIPTAVPLAPTATPTSVPAVITTPTPTTAPAPTPFPIGSSITKKVYLVVFNPRLSAAFGPDQTHIRYYGANDPYALTTQAINWFKSVSNGRINYVLARQVELNKYPALTDGFSYVDSTYHSMITGDTPVHVPVWANYNDIVTETSACELFNSGEIDEVWMFGGSWFGFYESRLAGTNAFWYNSPALTGTTCTKPMPIMGYNFERGLPEMIHDYGHRAEYTMMKVYTTWARTRIYTNFDRFAIVASLAPTYGFSGCGKTHFPPNAPSDYDYSNMFPALTLCDDFLKYPNLATLADAPRDVVDCRTWDCTDIGFFTYWFTRFPQFMGTAPDGKLNDWWDYMLNPSKAL